MKTRKLKSTNKLLFRSVLAFSNAGRGLLVGVFGLVLNYILVHYKSHTLLNNYVYFITITNLFLVITNWGGKFFNNKEISQHPNKIKTIVADLFSSKLLLMVLASVAVLFLPVDWETKLLLFVFLFLKSVAPIFDSLIVFKKKFLLAFLLEIILYATFLLLVFLDENGDNAKLFLQLLVGFEFVKFMAYAILMKAEIRIQMSFANGISILKKSSYFFAVALGGFLMSKSDLYIVGLLLDATVMSQYFIITSLVSVSMVLYATLINTFETNIYRFNFTLFKKFENFSQLFGCVFALFATLFFYLIGIHFYNLNLDAIFYVLFFVNLFAFAVLNLELYRFTKIEKQKTILKALLSSGILTCILSLVLIPLYSINGAFLANTIGVVFNYLLLKVYFLKLKSHAI